MRSLNLLATQIASTTTLQVSAARLMPCGLRKKSSAALRPTSQAVSSVGCRASQESLRAPEPIATASGHSAPPRPNTVEREDDRKRHDQAIELRAIARRLDEQPRDGNACCD